MTVESPSIRRASRRVLVSYTIVRPSNCPAASNVPSGLNDTSVVSSDGRPSGLPIACSPLRSQTTAELRCELARVRPSGLNATPLTGLVSALSGEPYGKPVSTSQTKTDPSNEPAANNRPPGLRSSEATGSLPAESGGPSGRPVPMSTMYTDPESSLAINVRPPSAKITASTFSLPTSSAGTDSAPRGDLPDPDGSGSTRGGDPLRIRAERERLRATRPRWLRRDRPADHPATLSVPQRDVVRFLRARSDDLAVRAVADDRERRLIGCRRCRVLQLPKLVPPGRVPQLDAALCAGDRQRAPVGAEVDPLFETLRRLQRRADGLPGCRVPERGPLDRHRGQERPAGIERARDDGRVEPLKPRVNPRAVLERAQERASRVDRIVEAACLQGEKHRKVRMLCGHLPRLGGEASRLGDGRCAPRASALGQREASGNHRHHQRRCDDRKECAQAPGSPSSAAQLTVLCLPARLQELALDTGELPLLTRQLGRRGETRPAVQIGFMTSCVLPRARRSRQLPDGTERFPILRQPSAQTRPLTDEGLVGDLGRVVVHDQEP